VAHQRSIGSARHQYEHALETINFNLEWRRKYSEEIEKMKEMSSDDARRMMPMRDIDKPSGEIKAASDQVSVLEYRIAHADDLR
jgi:hypothetical protein